ncbi:hypothetical protein Zmor_013946 [Zophobas morio]|uniref:Uncharacterized protein n=1 Tax=Zophobas morio TaxID=2755281 RepID=A0AA38IDW6_9CUCU|nr:hypothetical protein Zmor_013946 [Zophobas morio]
MISRLITSRNVLRTIRSLTPARNLCSLSKVKNYSKVFLIGASYPFSKDYSSFSMDDFDLKLKEACERGESAITELMNMLQTSIKDVTQAYKESLKKQITLIDEATKEGASSSKWDDLPQFRTQAAEMSQQFQKLVVTINTLGGIAKNETLKYITQQEKQFQLLSKKHKELEKLIIKQMEEIKGLEEKLLQKNRENISIQRGNKQRRCRQKHQNKTSFKNSLHNTSQRTKLIKNIQVRDCCVKCKGIIEWKRNQPRRCVRCDQGPGKCQTGVSCYVYEMW